MALAAAVLLSGWAFFSPDPPGPDTGIPAGDKLAHLVIFAALTALSLWCGVAVRRTLLLVALYAVATEVVQGLAVSGRSASVLDLVADAAGITTAAALWRRSGQ